MAAINMVKTMKKIYPKAIIMVKVGNFYYMYDKDCYIVSYLFNYKIKESDGYPSCAFPDCALDKVKAILAKKQLNFAIIEKASDFEETESCTEYPDEVYDEVFKEANCIVSKVLRVQTIYDRLMADIESEKMNDVLLKIEKIVKEDIMN